MPFARVLAGRTAEFAVPLSIKKENSVEEDPAGALVPVKVNNVPYVECGGLIVIERDGAALFTIIACVTCGAGE